MVDTINLYEVTETLFESNGIGSLPDASKCEITEERNGEYELSMEYPITGKNYSELKLKRIILAKPNPDDRKQPFRIYNISRPLNGIVTVKAEHVRYDLSGYPALICNALSAATALSSLISNTPVPCPFTTWSNRSQSGVFNLDTPTSILSVLGGNEGSVLDIFGGEYEWDRFEIKLHHERGKDRGVTIRYGKNLTDLTQDENCSNVYTGVLPYWQGTSAETGEAVKITLPEYIVNVVGTFDYTRILTLDLSSEFQEAPSTEALKAKTEEYIATHNIGVPDVNLKVSFAKLSQSEEYKDYQLLETVKLCDTVTVQFPDLGVDATSKVVSTTYDCLTGKYKQIELGSAVSRTLTSTIAQATKTISEEVPTISMVQSIAEETSKLFNGLYGGYIMENYLEGQSLPYEILVMDTDNINTARNIIRLNNAGIGFSNNGYDGPWVASININGNINGQMIEAGSIRGSAIQSGTINIDDLSGFEQIVMRSELTSMSEYFEDGELWFDFDKNRNSGLWIGRKDSRFAINITNTMMSFVELPEEIELVTITGHGYFIDNDKTQFLKRVNSKAGDYEFVYGTDNAWYLNGSKVQLYLYGLAEIGTPVAGWTIHVKVQSFANYADGNIKAYVAYNKLFIPTAHTQERLEFGKNYRVSIDQVSEGLSVEFFDDTEGPKQFIAKVNNQNGQYQFEYKFKTWNDAAEMSWDQLALMTWDQVGANGWYLNDKRVLLSDYGLELEGTPEDGDTIICTFNGEPMVDFAFIVKESGALQFKWVGE